MSSTIGTMFYYKYGYRQQRTDLKESLRTIVYISEQSFKNAMNRLRLQFVGYNLRCHHFEWIDPMNKTIWFIENLK